MVGPVFHSSPPSAADGAIPSGTLAGDGVHAPVCSNPRINGLKSGTGPVALDPVASLDQFSGSFVPSHDPASVNPSHFRGRLDPASTRRMERETGSFP